MQVNVFFLLFLFWWTFSGYPFFEGLDFVKIFQGLCLFGVYAYQEVQSRALLVTICNQNQLYISTIFLRILTDIWIQTFTGTIFACIHLSFCCTIFPIVTFPNLFDLTCFLQAAVATIIFTFIVIGNTITVPIALQILIRTI